MRSAIYDLNLPTKTDSGECLHRHSRSPKLRRTSSTLKTRERCVLSKPFRDNSWPVCFLFSTKSSSALTSSGCCAPDSFRKRKHITRRASLRCGRSRCGNSAGSSYDRDRHCTFSHFSSSDSIRRDFSFGRRSCQGCKQSCSCGDSRSSCYSSARRGHRSPGSPHLKHFSSSTRNKVSGASTRLPSFQLPTAASAPVMTSAVSFRAGLRRLTGLCTCTSPAPAVLLLRGVVPPCLSRPRLTTVALFSSEVSVKVTLHDAWAPTVSVRAVVLVLLTPMGTPIRTSPASRAAISFLAGVSAQVSMALPRHYRLLLMWGADFWFMALL